MSTSVASSGSGRGALLEVVGLDAFYGDFQALFGVSLEVAEGETLAIIGANGAGKSTLLASVAGLLLPAAGEIRFDGKPLGRLPAHRAGSARCRARPRRSPNLSEPHC